MSLSSCASLLALLTTTVLVAGLPSAGLAADEVIDGTAETVIGVGGPGTQPSPWDIDGDLIVGDEGTGSLAISAGGVVTNDYGQIGYSPGSNGTVTVTGPGSTWTNAFFLQVGGRFGDGTLDVSDGGTVYSEIGYVGYEIFATGEVTVTGDGSLWEIDEDLFVGEEGTGTLTISGGGTVTNLDGSVGNWTNSHGTVEVTGSGSSWANSNNLVVAARGEGSLTIADGGSVTSANGTTVGNSSDGVGIVDVTGDGSSLVSNGNMVVGGDGSGTLTVSDGGSASTGSFGYIGAIGVGIVEVTGEGSSFTTDGLLNVGFFGSGTLVVVDGAEASTGTNAFVGNTQDASGSVSVTGSDSSWSVAEILSVGERGEGTLTIADQGDVEALTSVRLARFATATGTLNIGAASDEAAAAAGTLATPVLEFGAGDGTLVFNHTGTGYAFDTPMTGSGTISHFAGITSLNGDSSGFSGTTTISGGTLLVNETLGGTVVLNSGGVLGGGGTLGIVDIGAAGQLAPGNSIGTLGVTSATFSVGSFFEVELNDGGFVAGTNNDLLDASGAVMINGGTVHVTPENGTDNGMAYTPGTYTIIAAGGGVAGTFDALTDDYAFLDFSLDYATLNEVNLISSLAGGGGCPAGQTFNQGNTCTGVISIGTGNLYNAVIGLSNDEAAVALDLLSGEIHASAQTALIDDAGLARDAAINRLRQLLGEHEGASGTSLWMDGSGAVSRSNSDGNAAALDLAQGGLFVGGDSQLMENVYLGIFAGYGRSSLEVVDRSSSATIDGYTVGAYGAAAWNSLSLKGEVAKTWHGIDTDRSVTITGFSDELAASYMAGTAQGHVEAAYAFDTGNASIEHYAGLSYVHANIDGFTESGGPASLTVAASAYDALYTMVGIRSETEVELDGATATLSGGLGWYHGFLETPETTHRFSQGVDFAIAGVPGPQDILTLAAGVDLQFEDGAAVALQYDGQLAAGHARHGVTANLSVGF